MLKQRLATAAILLPLILLALFLPTVWLWRVVVSLFIAVAWWEWVRMSGAERKLGFIVFATAIFVCLLIVFAGVGFLLGAVILMMLLWFVAIGCCYLIPEKLNHIILPQTKLLFGAVVLAYSWWSLIWLREQPNGPFWVLGFLIVIWLADTGAYFSGKRFGKRKLAPHISPGKTVEGFLGGLLCVVIYSAIVPIILDEHIGVPLIIVIFIAICLAIVSVGGDLLESWLKRRARMKDSSQVLPGHGGVLDRIDSLIATLPFMLFAYSIMTKPIVKSVLDAVSLT